MATSSMNHSIAPEAVQILVSSLADSSSNVRDASMLSLKEIAPLNPLLVLECCSTVSRGGRRRFGNMAGIFFVMASAVGSMENKDVDPVFMGKLAKLATAEMITTKELDGEWQKAASTLLVTIGSHLPDLMMEEIFLHLTGPSTVLPAMVQVLANFASAQALLFAPHVKGILSRILPILGNVKDPQRPIFANALKCWCQAVWLYWFDFPSFHLDGDVMSFLNSAFELLLKSWATSYELKVRLSSVVALGQMVDLITRIRLKESLPRFIPIILDLCKKDQESALLATCTLHNLLNACLSSEHGPPLLSFEENTVIISSLLPMLCINYSGDEHKNLSMGLKTYNEVHHCLLTVGLIYPDDLSRFLLNNCKLREGLSMLGSLCILKQLLPRLSQAWHDKRPVITETVKSLLDEKSVVVRKALAELIVVMASDYYFIGPSGEPFIEFLVRHCAISDDEIKHPDGTKGITWSIKTSHQFLQKNLEEKTGSAVLDDLEAVCGKGLLLVSITIPEMQHTLWPFLLKTVIPRQYTGAVAIVCRCISELCRRNPSYSNSMLSECRARDDIPKPEELFARLLVLLHDPLAREQMASQILTVLYYLSPLFPKNIGIFWQDEIAKMKAYISDPEDLKQDLSYQETWDSMIVNFLAETLDVIGEPEWVLSLGNAFAQQYKLYSANDEHSALLHRCLGMLLQKVDDMPYVREKIDVMYNNANILFPANRLGLAKGIGLVAASHLDTVLYKLKNILDNVGGNTFQRFLSFFSMGPKLQDPDEIHAALALMYGYAARYAPSTVIETRIDALVGTNMLSRLLHVRRPAAKQAVITAIELLGHGVINAAECGSSFPLKRRDQMLDYILTLMGKDDNEGFTDSGLDFLHTQTLALRACTTLVSVEPRLTPDTRNLILKATLRFFALPPAPSDVMDQLIENLITLLCTILLTSGEDGRSRAEQLLHILRQIDYYVSSPIEHQRKRACLAVYEMLLKFRSVCSRHAEYTAQRSSSNLPSAFVLPTRESLCLGERIMVYLTRCADTNTDIRKIAAQILNLFFSISLSLPKLVGSATRENVEMSYEALNSLEDVIAMLKSDASIDQSEVFSRIVSCVCILLTTDELVVSLHGCASSICDKTKQSAEGAVQSVTELIIKRGQELTDNDVARATQSLLCSIGYVMDKYIRQEVFGAISCLAENTNPKVVFNEILDVAGNDIAKKDISRLRGGWPMQDAFHVFSQHPVLSVTFLQHVLSVFDRTPFSKDEPDKGETVVDFSEISVEENILEASIIALTAFFRGGGKIGRKAVEQNYAFVFSTLTLYFGGYYFLLASRKKEPAWNVLPAFQSFCDCVGDIEMGKMLARSAEQGEDEKWINLIGDLAGCIFIKRPKEIHVICLIFCQAMNGSQSIRREASAAALSEFARYSCGDASLLETIVEAMCLHVVDESPSVRRLCLKGLVQIPTLDSLQYTGQILGVIVALLEDNDESVQVTAVKCLLTVLESSPNDVVNPIFLNLSIRLRNLQMSLNPKMRAKSFSAFGALSKYGVGVQHDNFLEQVHATLPRLILHIHDDDSDVRQACWNTMRQIVPLMEVDTMLALMMKHFNFDNRNDYEDFVRDLSKQLCQNFSNRSDAYLSSSIQGFDAPWPVIQANAIYFSSVMLSLLDDPRLVTYDIQVLSLLVGKMSQSLEAIVRTACSTALGLLLKDPKSIAWKSSKVDR